MPKQLMFATMWGLLSDAGGPYPLSKLPELLQKLKTLGYSGIELPIAFVMKYGSSKFEALLQSSSMLFIAQVFSSGAPPTPGNLSIASEFGIEHLSDNKEDTRDVGRHKSVWGAQIQECAKVSSVLYAVNSHTGKDYFNEAEQDDLFSFCTTVEASTGLTINHETHRARILYSPWPTPRVFSKHPALHFTADLSHFSCVTETGAGDPEVCKVVALITPRVRHVHARVGFEEGPQVPDPRAPLWQPYMDGYLLWWKAIYRASLARGDSTMSTTPEFGPFSYAWVKAYSKLSPDREDTYNNIWAVNHWVGLQMSKLYSELGGEGSVLKEDSEEGNWTL